MKNEKAIIICKGLFGDSFTLGGNKYILDAVIHINGIDTPVAMVPLDD